MLANLGRFALELDNSGAIRRLAWDGVDMVRDSRDAGIGLRADGRDLLATVVAVASIGEALVVEHAVVDGRRRWRLRQRFAAVGDRLERSLELICDAVAGDEPDALDEATLLIDGWSLPGAGDASVSVPMARLRPGIPVTEAIARPRDLTTPRGEMFDFLVSAPDVGVNAVCLTSSTLALHTAVVPLPRECPAFLHLHGDEGRLVVRHRFACESLLRPGDRIEIGRQAFLAGRGDWRAGATALGRLHGERGCMPPARRADWMRGATIYEADLHHHGGLAAVSAKLPGLRDLGFDTIYLMPWHAGGYGTIDYDVVDAGLGTRADLRALCDHAHRLGMRVLFDLLVNIANESSRYHVDHPDWFYRGADGAPLRHPMWGGHCFDPASPGLRAYLVDYARRCCADDGADGFRVDAVAYRGGNRRPLPGLQPHQHAHAIFTLMAEIRAAITAAKPSGALLAECFGPMQAAISDGVCRSWITWLDWALDRLVAGTIDGATLGRLLGEHALAMPPGTWLTGYTQTHDTVAFEKRDHQGPAVDALFTVLGLVDAGLMVFGGGWGMRERPAPGEADRFRALCAARRRLGGVAADAVRWLADADPSLLIAERPSAIGDVRIVANFGRSTRSCPPGEVLYRRGDGGSLAPHEVIVIRI